MPRRALLFPVVIGSIVFAAWSQYALRAQDAAEASHGKHDPKTGLGLPPGWPEGHPVPQVQSNCMKCHLTAGRELSAAVLNFSHSVHDLNQLSCHDCHGGNTEDDAAAHEEEAGFIGTKLSAHWKKCQECHEAEAAIVGESKHRWDFSKRINIDYPMCIDCHGNHDIGDPSDGYHMKDACGNCHDPLDKELPKYSQVIEQFDAVWTTLSQVRQQRMNADEPLPPELAEDVAALRGDTMRMMHGLPALDDATVREYTDKATSLRERLAAGLDREDKSAAP